MNTKKLLTLLFPCSATVILLALSLIMASCGQDEDTAASAPDTTTAVQTAAVSASDTTVSSDTTETVITYTTDPSASESESDTEFLTTVTEPTPTETPAVTTAPTTTSRPKPPTTSAPTTTEREAVTVTPPIVEPTDNGKDEGDDTEPILFNGHLLTHPVLDEERYVIEDILETSPVKYIENPEEAFPNATFTRKYMTRNDCYWYENQRMTVHGITVHSTASPGVMAPDWFDRWNRSRIHGEIGRDACVHAFTDDKNICQYLPWNHRGWHARGLANSYFIGIEMCEPSTIKYANNRVSSYDPTLPVNVKYFNAVYNNTVDLCVELCLLYDLNASDIISHKEGRALGLASNHGDPDHWFKFHGKDMDDFRADVNEKLTEKRAELEAQTTEAQTVAPPENTTVPTEDTTVAPETTAPVETTAPTSRETTAEQTTVTAETVTVTD